MGCWLKTTPWLLILFVTDCAVGTNAETSSEVQRLVQEILRKSSGISENTVAVLFAVEKLALVAKNATGKLDKILNTGEDVANLNLNVSDNISLIRNGLRVLDDLVETSRGNNITLKNIEENLKGVTSLVDGISKNISKCSAENCQNLEELSMSLPQKMEEVIKEHCDVSSTVWSLINQTVNNDKSTRSVDSLLLEDLARVVRSISVDVTEFKKETGKKLQDIQSSLELVRRQVEQESWKKSIETAVNQVLNGMRHKKVVWYAQNVREAIDESAKSLKADIDSREFTIGGYKARLRVHVNSVAGDTWLGAFFRLCPFPDDDFLQWPFVTPFTLSFLHPTDSLKDQSFDVLLEDFTGSLLQAVQKPKDKCKNEWIGFPNIIKVDALQKMGFSLDDGLSLAVELHPRE